ncbi:MAG TPA: hypothetical protein DCR14_18160 [Acidimicrobiaceae bacterium]|nr:hypothetical protein [Acidimicrobiaceae bacterium]
MADAAAATSAAAPLPVVVIGGYLGAGKTTLVNQLLRTTTERLVVLVNDFGSSVIDASLIEAREGDVLQLAGGCVCCQIGDDLSDTLHRLVVSAPSGTRPDRVVIEASGVAQPASVAATVAFSAGLDVECVVVVADGERIERLLADHYVGDLVAAQLRQADLVLVNRDCGADLSGVTSAPVIPDDGAVVDLVSPGVAHTPVAASELAPASAMFASTVVSGAGDIDSVLAQVRAIPRLVRAKGFVHSDDGVRLVQIAGERTTVSRWGGGSLPPAEVLCISLR